MRRGFPGKLTLALAGATALGGCVQATRHSNTMIFGTNTTFGLSAGQDVSGIPSMTVGYRRQEAVVMPLVANAQDNGTYQTPCPVNQLPEYFVGDVPPCLLVARRGDAIDSYSVLASFGARFGGRGSEGSASGGLAQFFSTGIASQFLAVNGGAALVAVSQAAEQQPNSGEISAMQSLASSTQLQQRALTVFTTNRTARETAMTYLTGLPPADFNPRFAAFAQALGLASDYCANLDKIACVAKLNTRNEFAGRDAARIDQAIAAAKAVTIPAPNPQEQPQGTENNQ